MSKRRRFNEPVRQIRNVIEYSEMRASVGMNPWLVEWSDKTRTWEPYDYVKDTEVFMKRCIESYSGTLRLERKSECTYIS